MNVPASLKTIIQDNTLMVITGNQRADFYLTREGKISKVDGYEIPTPTYLDREGFFMTAGRGKVIRSGAVYENLDYYIDKKFIKTFQEKIKNLIKDYKIKEIYLFSPDYMTGLVLSCFPKAACSRLRMCAYGNYTKAHPKDLLETVKNIYEQSLGERVPRKWEALKILKKALQAGKVIGNKDAHKGKPLGRYKLRILPNECSC